MTVKLPGYVETFELHVNLPSGEVKTFTYEDEGQCRFMVAQLEQLKALPHKPVQARLYRNAVRAGCVKSAQIPQITGYWIYTDRQWQEIAL